MLHYCLPSRACEMFGYSLGDSEIGDWRTLTHSVMKQVYLFNPNYSKAE